MKEKDKHIVDELFRSKLYDFEADTTHSDWEAISGKLPEKAAVAPFRRIRRYWAAAAAIVLLLLMGGIYRFLPDRTAPAVAESIQEPNGIGIDREQQSSIAGQLPEAASSIRQTQPAARQTTSPVKTTDLIAKAVMPAHPERSATMQPITDRVQRAAVKEETANNETDAAEATGEPVRPKQMYGSEKKLKKETETRTVSGSPKEKKIKRWGFGMGGGSISTGTSQVLNTYMLKSAQVNGYMANEALLMHYNAPYFNEQTPRTNIRHKAPVSVGLGVSYALTDRWSLLSGLNYTFLSSKWENNTIYKGETTQHLHFVGIPLSLSYTIAEWKRFRLYAAAGVMVEKNIAGRLKVDMFKGDELLSTEIESIRMREWSWSVNGRTGISYPLLPFVSVYAETGADYYFDNGSSIETIRSEKPFNINLQAGFRFGF